MHTRSSFPHGQALLRIVVLAVVAFLSIVLACSSGGGGGGKKLTAHRDGKRLTAVAQATIESAAGRVYAAVFTAGKAAGSPRVSINRRPVPIEATDDQTASRIFDLTEQQLGIPLDDRSVLVRQTKTENVKVEPGDVVTASIGGIPQGAANVVVAMHFPWLPGGSSSRSISKPRSRSRRQGRTSSPTTRSWSPSRMPPSRSSSTPSS
jgi:hypothetical protein